MTGAQARAMLRLQARTRFQVGEEIWQEYQERGNEIFREIEEEHEPTRKRQDRTCSKSRSAS